MQKQKYRDSLTLNYKALNEKGSLQSKSVVINNLSDEITDEDLFGIAQSMSGLIFYGVEEIHRKLDFLLLED